MTRLLSVNVGRPRDIPWQRKLRRGRHCRPPVVIVLDLHDLVAWAESSAEAFDADLSGRIQSLLQLDIE